MYRIALLICCLVLSGCPIFVLGGAATTGVLATQERTMGKAVDDFTLLAQIKHRFLQQDIDHLLAGVSVEVVEGRVLLTGNVQSPATRIEAVRLAWQPDGVKEVINEIQVEDERNFQTYATDKWIKAQIAGRLIGTSDIHSVNYSVEVINGVVYLMGIAQDTEELNNVTNIASTTKNVVRVISHVRLKDDPNRP